MRSALLLAVAAVLAVAVGAAAGGPEGHAEARASTAPASPAADLAPPPGPKETALVLKPGDAPSYRIVADGGPLVVLVKLNHGASLGGTLHGPKGCGDDAFMTTVIGVAYEGQTVARTECDVPAGPLEFTVQGGESAFVGSIRLEGGAFVPA